MISQPSPRMNCPLDAAMSMIEGKWKTVILCRMMREARPLRFKELMEVEGISARILTKQLREMEADGLVVKRSYSEVPPRTEYSLTAKAESLAPILKELAQWGMDNMFQNRVVFDAPVNTPDKSI
ncbi:MAG: helix-turn-helix transcriptional regulator [Candidatus Methanomethylophilaceae archaeon]|nr:helix-turn-helix transcriptional regulator [Candidatus Methanomethylophilaceae archaeon]